MITNITVTPLGDETFDIAFQCADIAVASQLFVNFGTTSAYGQTVESSSTPTSDFHVQVPTGLSAFHFQCGIQNNASPHNTELSSDQIYPNLPLPGTVNITTFLRKSNQTILIWDTLSNGPNGEVTSVSAYNIYRSNNPNLETFDLIAQINATDLNGLVQTVFNEDVIGYYAYGVSGVNFTGEGAMTTAVGIDSMFDLDNLN